MGKKNPSQWAPPLSIPTFNMYAIVLLNHGMTGKTMISLGGPQSPAPRSGRCPWQLSRVPVARARAATSAASCHHTRGKQSAPS